MKPSRVLFITTCIICIMITYSCDPEVCGDWWFINRTEHQISVDVYCHGGVSSELSFSLLPYDSLKKITCGIGYSPSPFVSSICSIDSILLVFNDTLSLNTFNYLEFAPINNIEKISKTKFRYEFTESHYQKALEVNGY